MVTPLLSDDVVHVGSGVVSSGSGQLLLLLMLERGFHVSGLAARQRRSQKVRVQVRSLDNRIKMIICLLTVLR